MYHAVIAQRNARDVVLNRDPAGQWNRLIRRRLQHEIRTAIGRNRSGRFRVQSKSVFRSKRRQVLFVNSGFGGWTIQRDPQSARFRAAIDQHVHRIEPMDPASCQHRGGGLSDRIRVACQPGKMRRSAFWPQPQHKIDGLTKSTGRIEQEPQQIIAGRGFYDALTNADDPSAGQSPVHACDVVAIRAETR